MRQYLNTILGKFGDKACGDPPTQGIDLAMYFKGVYYEPRKRGGYVREFEHVLAMWFSRNISTLLLNIHSGVYSVRYSSMYRFGLHVRLVLDGWETVDFETGMSRICVRCIAVHVFYRIFQDEDCCNRECTIYVAMVFMDMTLRRDDTSKRGCEKLALTCHWSLYLELFCWNKHHSLTQSMTCLFGGTLISDWMEFVSDWSEKPVSRSEMFWDDWCLILSCFLPCHLCGRWESISGRN